MTVQLKIGPRERTNQAVNPGDKPTFVKIIQNGPYSDPSSRNFGYMSDQFLMGWVKRSGMRDYFLREGRDTFIKKDPEGQYMITNGFLRDLRASENMSMTAQEKEFTLWLLEWLEKFKGKPEIIIELS